MNGLRNVVVKIGALFVGMMGVLPVAYGNVVYSASFESPTFATGPIAGQDGWSVFGPGVSTIENTFAEAGSQAVFVDGSTATQSGPFHSDSVPGNLIDLSADIAVFESSVQSEWQFAALGSGLFPFLGGIDIFPNNDIVAITAGFPVIGTFPRATAFDGSAWHNVNLLFNLTSQTYTISLDGSLLATEHICGDSGGCAGAPVSAYGTGFFDSFGQDTFGNDPGANDSGYMDNFQVSAVPEPGSIVLALIGFAAFFGGMRRKRSSAAR